ncbi:hypothetical protein [Winogradskyella ludwigii]|uniref:hypothetical protein n=1 Tax=Winogradskyella ludwigii TaxID=2686076 RepID=UPI0015CE565B|nr:hypothetical protein [Winogradskyella ludwigii]
MKKLLFYFAFSLLCLFSCNDNSNDIIPLQESSIMGQWLINSKGINNLTSTESICCEFIIFTEDDEDEDEDDDDSNILTGNYNFNGDTYGTFSMDLNNNTITRITENGNSYTQEYLITVNSLELWYYEGVDRYWVKYSLYPDE